MTTETRLEADSIGTMEVPAEAYYGVQALRAKQNFPITGTKLHPVFIRNLAQIKKAAAITNNNAGLLPEDKADAIVRACDEVIAGKLAEEFIVDAIQGGAGTSANMNMNEVIANRAGEILGCPKGSYKMVHPNDHVNMAQSTNDVIPTAGKLTVLDLLAHLEKAVDTLIVNCITGITANRKHCKDLMESSAGIATALCPHIGYKASATIAKIAVKTGKSVRELVLEQGIMTEKELEEVLDPYLMTEVGEERKEDEARRKAC